MTRSWLAELAKHYERTRRRYPGERLIILFDPDGAILDMRYRVLHLLQAFDRARGTGYFRDLQVSDIFVHENQVERLLAQLKIKPREQEDILGWYLERRWSSAAILEAQRPFRGVLEVIRWFQIQPDTYVGLNSGRPERLRTDTLRSLDKLGQAYRVQFPDELLYMKPAGRAQGLAGVRYFQEAGYRVFAVVDNEPGNLKAITEADPEHNILLLHADTIFESKRTELPPGAVEGDAYDLTELISEKALPGNIQLVWHGVNDRINLRQFLASDIGWGECDIRLDPLGQTLILRHDPFAEAPPAEEAAWLTLDELLARLRERGKLIKLDLKVGGEVIDLVLEAVARYGFEDAQLWFNGNVERLQQEGFRRLAAAHPGAILQCPVDFLAPLICSAPDKAKEIVAMFATWGINRFSVSWLTADMRDFFDRMDRWGYEVNIYNVPDLEAFLQAALLLPRSITADFNFPKWYYFGRGSGHKGNHYQYSIQRSGDRE